MLVELIAHQIVRLLVAELSQVVIEDVVLSVQARIPVLHFFLLLFKTITIETGAILLLEVSSQEHFIIILGSLLATANETKERLLLLHRNGKYAAASLEVILELLMKMKR